MAFGEDMGWRGLVGLSLKVWNLGYLQVNSVRIELTHRTTNWCQGIACWGKGPPPCHGGIRCRTLRGWKRFISLIRISMASSDLLLLSQFRDGKLGGIFPKFFN